jgi:hypothetical protein
MRREEPFYRRERVAMRWEQPFYRREKRRSPP